MIKKHRFGTYEIQYDTILDHDVYEHLRVTFEVAREEPRTSTTVSVNGKPIGVIRIHKEAGKIKGYIGIRIDEAGKETLVNHGLPHKKLGKIAAMMVSDLV